DALDVIDAAVVEPLTAEISFGSTNFAHEPTIVGLPIVPEHIFSTFEDPSAEQIEQPVGTGPYRLDRFSDQLYTFVRNDEHWMAEEFEPRNLAWPSYTSQTMATAMQAGDIDWAGDFIANIDQIFVEQDPEHRGHWYPGNGIFNLTFNLEKELWQDLELRRGLSLAIDRQELADIAMLGYVDIPHPTVLPRPTFEEFISEDLRGKEFDFDPDEAERVVAADPFRLQRLGDRHAGARRAAAQDRRALHTPGRLLRGVDGEPRHGQLRRHALDRRCGQRPLVHVPLDALLPARAG